MSTGVGRIRTQDVERRQGFTRPNHRSCRFFASASKESFQKEKAAAKREKVSGWPVNLAGRPMAFAFRWEKGGKILDGKHGKLLSNRFFFFFKLDSKLSHSTDQFVMVMHDIKNSLTRFAKLILIFTWAFIFIILFCLEINFDTLPLHSLIPASDYAMYL